MSGLRSHLLVASGGWGDSETWDLKVALWSWLRVSWLEKGSCVCQVSWMGSTLFANLSSRLGFKCPWVPPARDHAL